VPNVVAIFDFETATVVVASIGADAFPIRRQVLAEIGFAPAQSS
jgi:hypothetical protein